MKIERRFVWIFVLALAFSTGMQVSAAAENSEPGLATPTPPESSTELGAGKKSDRQELILDSKVEIEKCDFGIVTDRTGPTKEWSLHPVVVIPNLPGIQYAWRIRTKARLPVFVREEFTLPEPPSSWKINQNESPSQLLNGGQQCILESFQLTDEGWLGHSWTASCGDPAGTYQIKIWINGELAHTFVFNVGEPIDDPNNPKRDI